MTTPTPSSPAHFDYPSAARDAGISSADLARIIQLFERDYPSDLMLRELHILRACESIRAGRATLASILAPRDSRVA